MKHILNELNVEIKWNIKNAHLIQKKVGKEEKSKEHMEEI